MTDLSMPAGKGDTALPDPTAAERVADLLRECAADYASAAPRRQDHRDDAHLCAYAAEAVDGQ